jgi:hypothetical protein
MVVKVSFKKPWLEQLRFTTKVDQAMVKVVWIVAKVGF